MSNIISHNQLVPREEWSAAMHQRHLEAGGHADDVKTMLPNETIVMSDEQTARLAVSAISNIVRNPQPSFTAQINGWPVITEPLQASPNFANLSEGTTSEIGLTKLKEDRHVSNFLSERAEEVRRASKDMEPALDNAVERMAIGIKQGVEEGFIPKEVLLTLDEQVRTTGIKITDSDLLRLASPTGYGAGDYTWESDEIRLAHDLYHAPDFWLPPLTQGVAHEFLHKLSGGTFRVDEHGNYTRTRTSLGGYNHLVEAVNSHLESSVLTGDFSIVDPAKRNHPNSGSYLGGRKLLAELIEKSGGILQAKTLTQASFEDNTEVPQTTQRREMFRQGRIAYGTGVYRKFEALCAVMEAVGEHNSYSSTYKETIQALIDRIHGPKLGSNGEVIEVGYIDIDGLDISNSEDFNKVTV